MLRKLQDQILNPETTAYPDYADFIGAYCLFCQYKTIVELGVYLGETTLRLCHAAKANGGKVYGYDRFEAEGQQLNWNDPTFGKSGIENKMMRSGINPTIFKITKIDTSTDEFVKILNEDTKGIIDFAFIDADHSYKGIKNDFLKVYPYLTEEGSIMFHDTFNHVGCRKFILDLYQDFNDGTYDIINLPFGFGNSRCGLTILTKRSYPLNQTNLAPPCPEYDTEPITREEVYEAEKKWYNDQIKK